MPRDETARLEALRRYQILDTSSEQAFDDLALLASRICGTPMAAMSLIDETRQWFKARVGLEYPETPRAIALCAHTIQQKTPLIVPNAAKDDRFRENPLVKAKDGIRFYAGVPLITPDGHAIGTISVMDRKARTLEPQQIQALEALARQAEKQLEVRTYIDRLARTIEERESVERQLRDVNHFTSAIIQSAGEGIVVYDRSFRYVVWNRFMEDLTGMPSRHVLGQSAIQLFPHFRDQGIAPLLQKALAGEKVTSHTYQFQIPQTGKSGWVSATYGPNRDASGAITGVIGVVRDVTQEKRSKEALTAAEAKFRGLVEQSLVGIYVIQDGRYQYVNPKLAEIFGYTADEMLAMDSVMSLVSEEDRGVVQENIRRRLAGEAQTVRYSFRALRKDGQEIELEVHGAGTEFQGKPAIIGTLLDITDRKRAEAQIVYHAYHDPLTELPNRMLFMERLRLQLAQARRQSRKLSIVYFDLDHFKFVNDTLGHSVGDEFLQTVATRLKGLVREMDTVARVGGDEFVILIPDVSRAEDISIVAQKLLNSVSRPLQVEGRALNITASIGIATFPADGEDAETLLRNADTAMYRAKELGRNNFQLCTPELTSKAVERLTIQNGLRLALDRDELVLHYQPVVSLTSGRIVGLEALVRWQHAEKGLIMPGAFISVAEETGLDPAARRVGARDRRETIEALAERRVAGSPHGRQRLGPPVPRDESRPDDREGARRLRGRAAPPRDRDHGIDRDGERRGRRREPRVPAQHGRRHLHRRLRDGILVADLPEALSDQFAEDRPFVRDRRRHQPRRRRYRPRRRRDGPRHEAERHRRGRRDQGSVRPPAEVRLRRDAGLLVQQAAARRSDQQAARRRKEALDAAGVGSDSRLAVVTTAAALL